jgi:NAD(P)-dependent dehydrogenase (short-subunit alcohol dehydrogenase family)
MNNNAYITLEGKTAVVAGGAGAIGFAVAKLLREAGASVVVLDIDIKNAADMAGIVAKEVDLRDVAATTQAVEETAGGDAHILVNAAGINPPSPVENCSVEEWDSVQQVNLRSCFFLTQAVAPSMRRRKAGSIVFVSSCSAQLGYPGLGAYAASKGGIESLTRSLACELGGDGIRVNAIAPGTVQTPMTRGLWEDEKKRRAHEMTIPFGRLAQVRDVANAALFFASDLSSFITGAVLPVDGGLTAMQADFIDHRLRSWD